MPRERLPGSTVAKTMQKSAMWPLPMNFLRPLRT
jgi:hypothetical protein